MGELLEGSVFSNVGYWSLRLDGNVIKHCKGFIKQMPGQAHRVPGG
jgi:hypothetical protein